MLLWTTISAAALEAAPHDLLDCLTAFEDPEALTKVGKDKLDSCVSILNVGGIDQVVYQRIIMMQNDWVLGFPRLLTLTRK